LPQDKEIALEAVTQIPFACAAELFQRHGRGLGVLEKFVSKMSLCDAEVCKCSLNKSLCDADVWKFFFV
jgi:hypothetical protein